MTDKHVGIILAGGNGTRLHPVTLATCKQLLPVFDKPLIFYPLSTLMLAKIRDVIVIHKPEDEIAFKRLLGDGSSFGMRIRYKVQIEANGIAQAINLCREEIANKKVTLILGDNIFIGNELASILNHSPDPSFNCRLFVTRVKEPEKYGVLFQEGSDRLKIIEKPDFPSSNLAVTGLYVYDENAVSLFDDISVSSRGEYEITDLNNLYLERFSVEVTEFGRGLVWYDGGSSADLLEVSNLVNSMQSRSGLLISSPHEICCRNDWMSPEDMKKQIVQYGKSSYFINLRKILETL